MPLVVPAGLIFGADLVASPQHDTDHASAQHRAGVFVVVVGLIWLGFLVRSYMR